MTSHMTRRAILASVVCAVVLGGLAYLRDPPWILSMTSGLRPWETGGGGERFRWMGGHASFFVPASARAVEIPLRTTFERPQDWPIVVSVSLDDRPVDRQVLSDAAWRRSVVRLPPPGTRRARRIDIRVDRTRDDNRGAAVGELEIR